jgi:hypothetical protein
VHVPQWEYRTVDLPRDAGRERAREVASLHGLVSGWELLRHRIWPDGRRRLTLRRPVRRTDNPGQSGGRGLLE